jgi:hypothetical protein
MPLYNSSLFQFTFCFRKRLKEILIISRTFNFITYNYYTNNTYIIFLRIIKWLKNRFLNLVKYNS